MQKELPHSDFGVAKVDLRCRMRERNQTINSFFPISVLQRKKHVIGLTRETNVGVRSVKDYVLLTSAGQSDLTGREGGTVIPVSRNVSADKIGRAHV